MSTTIPTYRYQYRQPPSSSQLSGFSLSPPRNTLPHHYLESPTNIFSHSNPFPHTLTLNPGAPEKIIIRQVGGPGDNHVQWVSKSDIIPYYPDSDEEPSSAGEKRKGGKVSNGDGKKGIMKAYGSQIHGIVHRANWTNDVGDRLWLRSDQPIIKGRRSVPVVNLDKGVSGEVCVNSVNWCVDKREISTGATITFIGADYRHVHVHGRRGGGGGPFRMCVTQEPQGNREGIIEMIPLDELDTCFEDVKPPPSVHDHSHSHVAPSTELQVLGDSNHISRQLRGPTAIFGETDSRSMDDDDDTLSHASFASSTKGKVALDLVARSLSIFNFNAAMLDLAALSNQSMGGFIRDIDEQPEASDDSDEEDGDEEEERVWSDCEYIQSSGRQSVMDEEDDDEDESSRAGSGSGSGSGSGGDV